MQPRSIPVALVPSGAPAAGTKNSPALGLGQGGIFFVSKVRENQGSFLLVLRDHRQTVTLRTQTAVAQGSRVQLSVGAGGRLSLQVLDNLAGKTLSGPGNDRLALDNRAHLPAAFSTLPSFVGDAQIFSSRLIPILQEFLLALDPGPILNFLRRSKLAGKTQQTGDDRFDPGLLRLGAFLQHTGVDPTGDVPGLERLFRIFFSTQRERNTELGDEEDLLELLRQLQLGLPADRPRFLWYSLGDGQKRVGILFLRIAPGGRNLEDVSVEFFAGGDSELRASWTEPLRRNLQLASTLDLDGEDKRRLLEDLAGFGFERIQVRQDG